MINECAGSAFIKAVIENMGWCCPELHIYGRNICMKVIVSWLEISGMLKTGEKHGEVERSKMVSKNKHRSAEFGRGLPIVCSVWFRGRSRLRGRKRVRAS